jgi:hypothetical protein
MKPKRDRTVAAVNAAPCWTCWAWSISCDWTAFWNDASARRILLYRFTWVLVINDWTRSLMTRNLARKPFVK